jgi:GGDEF domain-containing protein
MFDGVIIQIMTKSRQDTNDMDKLYGDTGAFKIRAQEELRRARRYAAFVSLISMDLSHIDPEGDLENFTGLDEFMKSLKHLVRSSIRDTDVIGSARGKKLFLLLIDTHLEGARALSERLQKTIRYFMCGNIKSPLNWRVPMEHYCFPGIPDQPSNLESILEIIEND